MTQWSTASAPTTERLGVEAVPERTRRAPALKTIEGGAEHSPTVTADLAQIQSALDTIAAKEAALDVRAAGLAKVAATYEGASKVLAIRAQLLLAVIGAFTLAMYAMSWQSVAGLLVMIAWCVLTVMPLVWLEWGGRPKR